MQLFHFENIDNLGDNWIDAIVGQLPSSLPELVYQVNGTGFYNPAAAPATPRPVELRLTIEKGLPSVYSKVGQYWKHLWSILKFIC